MIFIHQFQIRRRHINWGIQERFYRMEVCNRIIITIVFIIKIGL